MRADGLSIKARASAPGLDLHLAVRPRADSGAGVVYERTVASSDLGVSAFDVTGLQPRTAYRYEVHAPGGAPLSGSFRTFADGPMSFKLAFASCASTGSESPAFDAIRALDPDLFIHMGDMHYSNIHENDVERFARAYDRVLGSHAQSALFRSVPLAYMWDDHDYGADDSDATSASRPAAQTAYRAFVPHYPLGSARPDGTIQQAFTIGRARVIMIDARSGRTSRSGSVAQRTMLGAEQLAWLEQELERSTTFPLVLFVSPVPWITKRDEGTREGWAPYAQERTRIATHIEKLGLASRLIMLSGDAHLLAMDDGTNSQYAPGGGHGFTVVQAAPLDRRSNRKGGPYSHAEITENGQFGLLEVVDDGTTLAVTMTGHQASGPVGGMSMTLGPLTT